MLPDPLEAHARQSVAWCGLGPSCRIGVEQQVQGTVSTETADAGQTDYFALLILVAAGAWRRQSV